MVPCLRVLAWTRSLYGTDAWKIRLAHAGGRSQVIRPRDRLAVAPRSADGARQRARTPAPARRVALDLPPLADLAVSLYLPGEILNNFQITRRYARQTNYVSPLGDFSAAQVMPIASLTSDWFFVCGVDVLASADTGGIVTLGDSLTDGNISTMDAFCRWPDQLARRLMARPRGRPMAVMNEGLGGNRILYDIRGDSGLRRFDRDVLSQPGVTHVIVMLGTNDLRNRWKNRKRSLPRRR
jgi:hypothetical protein